MYIYIYVFSIVLFILFLLYIYIYIKYNKRYKQERNGEEYEERKIATLIKV